MLRCSNGIGSATGRIASRAAGVKLPRISSGPRCNAAGGAAPGGAVVIGNRAALEVSNVAQVQPSGPRDRQPACNAAGGARGA